VSAPARPAARRRLRTRWLGWTFGALFAATALAQARLHTWQQEDTLRRAKATGRFIVERIDHARRGQIVSADGTVLAFDQDAFELSVDFRRLPRTDPFFVALGEASGVAASELAVAAAAGRRSLLWREPLTMVQAQRTEAVKRAWRADGVSLRRIQRRSYPMGAAASLIVGGWKGQEPLLGLEASQDRLLRGQDGFQKGMVDGTGAFLPMRMAPDTRTRTDGQSLELTIDARLQQAAFQSVRQAVEANKAQRGVAILLDPKTGDALALAQWPAFDPAVPGIEGQYDMAVAGAYEPGSTFKVLTLAKAMDMGLVEPAREVLCDGELRLNASWRVRCPLRRGTRAHGAVDAEAAIARSCNVAAASWALAIDHPTMTRFFDELRLLEPAGIGLPSERPGGYNTQEFARQLQLMQFGFGQSVQATPLALAAAFASLANGGALMQPRLIRKAGGVERPTRQVRQVFRPETADRVMRLMEAVIHTDGGTGARLRIPGYRLAGKTGTSERVGAGGGYVSSFIGFVPARAPVAAILVMIDDPRAGRHYGGEVAGPVFKDLAQAVIRHFRVPKEAAS
jgi:cell division protein FtsI/penicillin-binding protein 2